MEMITSTLAISMLMLSSNTNPITMALILLAVSISSTTLIFKMTTSSWLAFILVITFSSGMMTLLFYTTSLVPNEINKTKKSTLTISTLSIILMAPIFPQMNKTQSTTKLFSNYSVIMVMAMILILTMVCISTHGWNPNQALRSSF